MSELRKANTDELFFVTLTIVGWIDLFSREIYKEIVVDNLQYCQEKEGLEIYCYVIMSNHLHLICRRKEGDLTELLGRFKSYTAKQFLKSIAENNKESRVDWLLQLFQQFAKSNKQYSKHHLWQYTSHPVLLDSNHIIDQKINYIHNNPVAAGIVTEQEAYKYSSACPDSPLKVLEV